MNDLPDSSEIQNITESAKDKPATKAKRAAPVPTKPGKSIKTTKAPSADKVVAKEVELSPEKASKKTADKAKPSKVKAAKQPVVTEGKKVEKPEAKKMRLVRDSFKMPEMEYAYFGILKQRMLEIGKEVKKSELLRASLTVLTSLSDAEVIKALDGVAKLKTGRPVAR